MRQIKKISRRHFTAGTMMLASSRLFAGEAGVPPLTGSYDEKTWPSMPPPDCPFPVSKTLGGMRLLGRYARYAHADTWYPSWAADGNLYSPWTDGAVGDARSVSFRSIATTGQAVISGDDPMALRIHDARVYPGDPRPYGGRYPCGSLVYDGIWYYGTYCLDDTDGDPAMGLNWDTLGPFVGFRTSMDRGRTWQESPHTPARPIFGESGKRGNSVRFGSPHFVDFGRNMQHSPDRKAYLLAHGAQLPDPQPRPANASWITGDQIFLARVTPSLKTMNDPAAYEFFAGHDTAGRDLWTRSFAEMKPLLNWNNNCGCVTATWNPTLQKFLMCVTDGQDTISSYNTYILEADSITGPWWLVTYLHDFGEQAYFVNIPSKFIAAEGNRMWLCYSANFTQNVKLGRHFQSDPPGSGYGMTLQEIALLPR
jgi:hypothetical protein